MKTLTDHWNEIFRQTEEEKLGWHEDDYTQTLKFLDPVSKWKSAKIFVSGVGTSGLADLLSETDAELVLNDISSAAIEKMQQRYRDKKRKFNWLCQDISAPLPTALNDIDIWVDRAVLHFLTDECAIEGYFKNVHKAIKPGGYALFAEFSKIGAKRCAGLDVKQYDLDDFKKHLAAFELVASDEYTFTNPTGDPRPYLYALFKKKD